MDIYGKFYSPNHVLSYNRPWIMSIGSRSIGKSTGWMISTLLDYLKSGKRFIYLRRTDDEVKQTAPSCMDSAVIILHDAGFPVNHIVARNRHFWLYRTPNEDGEEKPEDVGMYFSLSMAEKYKSANFGVQNYHRIIYDEFISMDKTRYLGSGQNITKEFDLCLSLYQTVDRGVGKAARNETQFIFIANLATYFNPIFIGLGVDEYIRTDSKIIAPKGKLWVCEQTKAVEATADIKTSFAYQLSDSKNAAYAYDNIAFDESMQFVEKINKPMSGLFNVKFGSKTYGVYKFNNEDKIYISQKSTPLITIALTTDAQNSIDYTLSTRPTDNAAMQQVKRLYYTGRVICETKKIRYMIANYFMLTP